MLTEIDLQHRGRMCCSPYKLSSDGVACGSERQNLYTILSGQIKAPGLCITPNGTVREHRSTRIHRAECRQ